CIDHRRCARHGDAPRSRRRLSRDSGAETGAPRDARTDRCNLTDQAPLTRRQTSRFQMTTPTDNAMLAARAAAAIAITPVTMAKELEDARAKLGGGLRRLSEVSEKDLAIRHGPPRQV